MNWAKIIAIALVVVVALAAVAIGGYAYLRGDEISQNRHFSEELREGLVEACEKNGNPLRESQVEILEDEIQQSHSPLVYELFPSVPHERLRELIAESNAMKRRRIKEVAPVECASIYPAPGASGGG